MADKRPAARDPLPLLRIHVLVEEIFRLHRRRIAFEAVAISFARQIIQRIQQFFPPRDPPRIAHEGYDLLVHHGDMFLHVQFVRFVFVQRRNDAREQDPEALPLRRAVLVRRGRGFLQPCDLRQLFLDKAVQLFGSHFLFLSVFRIPLPLLQSIEGRRQHRHVIPVDLADQFLRAQARHFADLFLDLRGDLCLRFGGLSGKFRPHHLREELLLPLQVCRFLLLRTAGALGFPLRFLLFRLGAALFRRVLYLLRPCEHFLHPRRSLRLRRVGALHDLLAVHCRPSPFYKFIIYRSLARCSAAASASI